MSRPVPSHPDRWSDAERCRAQADGEAPLTESSDPRIAFEQELKRRVARAMQGDAAPADLRARVFARLSEAPVHTHIGATHAGRPHRRRSLWWAAAALVVIAGGLALVLPTRLSLIGPSSQIAQTPGMLAPERLARLISFTASQHDQCALLSDAFNSKMKARTEAEASKIAIELLPKVPSVLDLQCGALAKAGYQFAGLGRCAVPGRGRSAHLIYKPDPAIAPNAPIVSLFVQEDVGDLPLEFGCALRSQPCDSTTGDGCVCCVTMWRKDGLIYYLVAPPLSPEVRKAFDAPERERSIL